MAAHSLDPDSSSAADTSASFCDWACLRAASRVAKCAPRRRANMSRAVA